ncbi:MAG: substrate-binding domain-containing protein [Candidatus Kapabacteria bacterium]|nr:substrate-binding domain-containing protein [Candidatus Kapabacteria bacterium]
MWYRSNFPFTVSLVLLELTMNVKFLIVLVFSLLAMPLSLSAQVVVIVNKANTISSISTADLKNIFTGDMTKFASGTNITIVTYKSDTESRKKFYAALGKKYTECQAAILKRMMNDGLKPPAAFESDDDVAAYVAKTPGAIGFVNVANVGAAKVITVDGKKQID